MRQIYIVLWFLMTTLLLYRPAIFAQKKLTLEEVLSIAASNSIHSRLAETQKEIANNVFQTYKSDRRPQISFSGAVPMYNKSYAPITQPDGKILFIPVKQNFSTAGFSLSQAITATGGQISLNTNLSRFDDYITNFKQYNATPIFLALNQPLGGFNAMRWARKIEPLRFAEAKKAFSVEMEEIRLKATDLYFNVLEAQNDITVSRQNVSDYQANYDVETKRIALGTTNQDKLTQLELQVLEAEQTLKTAEYQLKIARLDLKVFAGITAAEDFEVLMPELATVYYPDAAQALAFAKKNRPEYIAFERKQLEAQGELARSKAEKYGVNVAATMGYNNSDLRFAGAYGDLKSQTTVGVEFDIPMVDWGRRNAKISTAKANLKLQQYQNMLDESTLAQQITTLVESLVLLQNNVLQGQKVQKVAENRYGFALTNYQAGKYTVTELSIAQAQRDAARKKYTAALREYWKGHFGFRKLTGFDPVIGKAIAETND
ncbi:TolC family protein [Chitinophaga agri]|uniref:TolC family protein n=1 Tax=Chitinophaga agri TaxID=2703787 RepID=A0A6B9ZNR9_9BACT|nr:TolC family protein [Chitinophaga agri]QHS63529.1 TolC family protein [Chitinophaga agri]